MDAPICQQVLGQSKTRLVIPSYVSETHRLHVFKTSHHPRLTVDHNKLAIDVALSTAAAPTYFDAHDFSGGSGLVDGGIWANNPTGLLAVEAAGVLDWDMSTVRLLSLGTSHQFVAPKKKVGRLGALKDNWIFDLMFRGQDRASLGTASILMKYPHENDHLLRIDPMVDPELKGLDNLKAIDRLIGIAKTEARSHLPKIINEFFKFQKDDFKPYATTGELK